MRVCVLRSWLLPWLLRPGPGPWEGTRKWRQPEAPLALEMSSWDTAGELIKNTAVPSSGLKQQLGWLVLARRLGRFGRIS